jgi:hypothetical protein
MWCDSLLPRWKFKRKPNIHTIAPPLIRRPLNRSDSKKKKKKNKPKQIYNNKFSNSSYIRGQWVPVTTAWRVLKLRMEERLADMKSSCEYIQ